MKKAYDYFEEFVKQEKRYPTLEEFKQWGYSKATYYRCKKDYQPTEPEEYDYAIRTHVEQLDNGITIIDLRF